MHTLHKLSFAGCALPLLLFSCKAPDQINHYDVIPDSTVTSVRQWVNDPDSIPSDYPLPRDSSAQMDLDIDQDGSMDFRVTVQHAYHNQGSNPPAPYGFFSFNLLISTLDAAANQVVIYTQGSGSSQVTRSFYTAGQNIPYECPDCIIDYQDACGIAFTGSILPSTPFGDGYVGVQLLRNGKYHYGWIHTETYYFGVHIKDYAFNGTEDNPVAAGQTE